MGAVKQQMIAGLPSDGDVARAMTPALIHTRITELSQHAQSDPERFHHMRDELYGDVLCAIAASPYWDAAELPAAALAAERVTPAWEACA